jgi:ABC-type dipeptide/oligopeptide/nickel transport system permease component
MVIGVLSWIIAILLALPLGIIVGNISGSVLIDAPLDPGFSLTGGHSMASHRVGILGHCEFLPCLESVPVDGERDAGI